MVPMFLRFKLCVILLTLFSVVSCFTTSDAVSVSFFLWSELFQLDCFLKWVNSQRLELLTQNLMYNCHLLSTEIQRHIKDCVLIVESKSFISQELCDTIVFK